jgi:PAS domain S-box-containing protein
VLLALLSGREMTANYWNDLKLARKGLVAAFLPSAALLLGFAALYGLSMAERRAQMQIERTLEVRNELNRVLAGIVTSGSGTRGFALTRSDELLGSTASAREDATKALAKLASLLAGNRSQTSKLTALRELVNDRSRLNEEIITAVKAANPPSDANVIRLVMEGTKKTEAIRDVVLGMDSQELIVHGQRTARLEQLRDIDVAATAVVVAFGIGGGFMSVLLVSRSTARRIRWIGDNAERLAAELPLQEKDTGKDEIGRVNEQLKAASALLRNRTQALRESESRLLSILDHTSSIVFMKDLQGRFILANPQFEKLFGLDRQAVIGHDVRAFFPPELADVYQTNDRAALASTGPLQFEEAVMQKDGPHTYLSTKFALRDRDGVPYALCGISTDITARKQAEEILRSSRDELEKHVHERTLELQQANEKLRHEVIEHRETAESLKRTNAQLLQAQKMEALGQIAGGIAHDFNNILTTIMGYGMLLLQQVPEEEREGSPVAEILRASERAGALSKQLLGFSRPQPTAPVVLSLNRVVENAEKMLVQAIGGRITLRKMLDPKLGPVRADIGQIEQLLLNLVINGRDAIRRTGEIEITTENVTLPAEEIKADASTNDFVSLSVRDTGAGIPPELMPRMFEPFFTTKRPGKGTGLGLATCSAIVQQSGGWIACQSQPGKGTRFAVFLPRVSGEVEESAHPRADGTLPSGREKVLVVEDEPSVGNLFECLLRKLGYEVVRAKHGEEAERAMADCADEAPIDLVLTDLDMPRMDGTELVRRLTKRYGELRIILTSGNGENFRSKQDTGFDFEFLPKPFSMQTLAQKVREVLDR